MIETGSTERKLFSDSNLSIVSTSEVGLQLGLVAETFLKGFLGFEAGPLRSKAEDSELNRERVRGEDKVGKGSATTGGYNSGKSLL